MYCAVCAPPCQAPLECRPHHRPPRCTPSKPPRPMRMPRVQARAARSRTRGVPTPRSKARYSRQRLPVGQWDPAEHAVRWRLDSLESGSSFLIVPPLSFLCGALDLQESDEGLGHVHSDAMPLPTDECASSDALRLGTWGWNVRTACSGDVRDRTLPGMEGFRSARWARVRRGSARLWARGDGHSESIFIFSSEVGAVLDCAAAEAYGWRHGGTQ